VSEIAALISDMVRSGVDPDLIGRTAAALASVKTLDEQAERRRQKDRERKARQNNSADSADSAEFHPSPLSPSSFPPTPPHITTPIPPPPAAAACADAGCEVLGDPPAERPVAGRLPDWFEPAQRVLLAAGFDPDDPATFGQRPFVARWLKDWDLELDILPTVTALTAARTAKGQGPPRGIRYFEAAIADAHATRTYPLPEGTPGARNVQTRKDRSKASWTDALDQLGEFARREPAGGGGGGAQVVQLLPPARSG